jgi:hypothetical protein
MLLDVFDGDDENSEPSKLFRKFEIVSILILIVLICFHPFFLNQVLFIILSSFYLHLYLLFNFYLEFMFGTNLNTLTKRDD